MKNFLFTILFTFCFFSFSFATHNRAGEITYRCLGGYTYEILVTTYTKTSSSAADRCEVTVYFGDGDSAVFQRFGGPPSSCSSGATGGNPLPNDIQKNTYKGTHTYPGPFNYTITMTDPNRNAGICNISAGNSVNTAFSLQSELVISPFFSCNDSPILNFPPIDNACVGECFEHNPSASDPEGDSLYYELTIPYQSPGVPVPLYTLPPNMSSSSINHFTGDLVWCSPPIICQYNVAIKIKQYHKWMGQWNYVGYVLRDMQIDVASCTNTKPNIAAINDTCIVAGTTLNFMVTATDAETNVLILSATGTPFGLTPAATFSSFPSSSPVFGNFSWTPNCSQIRFTPYLVTFKVKDSHPSTPLVDFESMFIRVIAPSVTGLTATPAGSSIILNWNPAICNMSPNPLTGYKIYRKNSCDPFVPAPCETGLPSTTGYTLIGTTNNTTLTFTDNNGGAGLAHGTTYSYIIVAYYYDGSQSIASTNVCTQLVQDVPIITNVHVMSTDNSNGNIWIHWVKPIGGAGNLDTIGNPPPYEYRLIKIGTASPLATYSYSSYSQLTDTGFVSTLLNTQSLQHTYRVDFYSNGNFIGSTNTASSVFLSSSPSDNKVILTWTEAVPWGNYLYHIYREIPTGSGTFVLIGTSTTQTYTDTGLANGIQFCYKVISEGQYSDPALPRPLFNASQIKCETPWDFTPPCQPIVNVQTDCGIGNNVLTWNNPNNSCADDVVQYNVYFAPTTSDPLQLIYTTTNLNDTTFTHVYLYDGLYYSVAGCYAVTAVDSFNNESAIVNKFCVDNCPIYELPNVFTPNGDGINDFFIPLPYRYVKDIDIKIYDRWGLLMFETTDARILWDGKNKDTKLACSDGTYYYVCIVNEIRVEGIKQRALKGFVQLINTKSPPNR